MSSAFSQALLALVVVVGAGAAMDYVLIRDSEAQTRPREEQVRSVPREGFEPERGILRVCADPNNMPFSNRRGEGFENELAGIVADALGWKVAYTWWPQRRGFIRNTLAADECDVVMGVPATYGLAQTTQPYYRSTYVVVSRLDDDLHIDSFEDPALRKLTIGLHAIGDDYNNVPPAQMLAMRGIVNNIRGYSIYGDYSKPDPPRDLIDAVANGEVDVAIAWGPLAGYFAGREKVPLDVRAIGSDESSRLAPMQFDIAMAVRRGDDDLKSRLDAVLVSRRAQIEELLARYHVPILRAAPPSVAQVEE